MTDNSCCVNMYHAVYCKLNFNEYLYIIFFKYRYLKFLKFLYIAVAAVYGVNVLKSSA